MKYLYRIETLGLGDFFVVEETMDKACKLLSDLFNKDNQGLTNRTIKAIHIVAKEVIDSMGRLDFSDRRFEKLVLPEHNKFSFPV